MKKIFLSLAMATFAVAGFAQHEVGTVTIAPKVGLSVATMTDTEDAKMRLGFVVGGEAEYQVTDIFSLSGGLLYSQQGAKGEMKDGDDYSMSTTAKLDYLNIPLLANVYVAKGLAVKLGVQPGFKLSAKSSSKVEERGNKLSSSVDIGKAVNGFNLSIPVGLSYEFSNFVVDARYNFGVTKAFKSQNITIGDTDIEMSDNKSKHSFFQFTVGYKFAL